MNRTAIAVAVGLASAAIIAFQLVIMQLLAIAQWHHFAYMVISMALLGFGAAGTVLSLSRDFFARHYALALPALFLVCAITMASTAWLSGVAGEFDAFLLFFDSGQVGLLLLTYLGYCLPFFFGGLAITLVFYREVSRIGAMYFANMAGSGAGAVLIIALLWIVPPPRLAGILALLPLAAAWLCLASPPGPRPWPASWFPALAVVLASIALPAPTVSSEYKPIHGAMQLPEARIVHRSTSPYGMLELVRADALRYAPSLSLHFRGEPPVRDVLFNDGEYFGTLLGRGVTGHGHVLDHTTRALPYALRDPAGVLVLHAAGGDDVSHALSHDARRIDAVEPHREVNRLLHDQHPDWIDRIYLEPAVALHGGSVRAYLGRGQGGPHDLIVLPVLGAFGGTAGVHALQEHYHLTLEAFRAMWASLSDEGMIVVTTWQEDPPRISLKLLATWRQLLDEHRIDERAAHVVAVRSWGTLTFLLSRTPFDTQERERLRQFCDELGFDPLLLEGLEPGERDIHNRVGDISWFADLDILLLGDPEELFQRYPFDIRPAVDDRPFFEHFMDWRVLAELRETYGTRELPYLEIGFVLAVVTLLQIVLAATVLIVLPLSGIGWTGTARRWTLMYFAGLGIGFMFFEIVLIQKVMLYLDQPVYAAATVLATLLVSSGAGSLFSARFAASRRLIAAVALLVAGLILLYTFGLRPVLQLSMGWPLGVKAAGVSLLLAPPAFFMGMMFPLGLRRLSAGDAHQIPWACAIDSCLSVSATALATMLALEAGFTAVMLVAAIAYCSVALAGPRLGAVPAAQP